MPVSQKQDGAGDLLRLADPAQGRPVAQCFSLGFDRIAGYEITLKALLEHIRVNSPRKNHVDPNAYRAELESQCAR